MKKPNNHTVLFNLLLIGTLLTGCSLLPLQPGQDIEDHSTYHSSAPDRHRRVRRAIQSQDLILGMSTSDVRFAWGEPRDVENAGHPRLGNQRWIYQTGLLGGLGSTRIVYFEGGKVVGWEN